MNPTVIKYGNTKKQEPPSLTPDEMNYILESLLFSLSVNVCADWDKNDYTALLDISKKVASYCNNEKLNNVTFYEDFEVTDDLTDDIKHSFKNKLNFIKYNSLV